MRVPEVAGLQPDLSTLVALFYNDAAQLGEFQSVTAAELPADYRQLLAHNAHMTVTVERFHGCLVDVHVLAKQHTQRHYSRKILLSRQNDGRIVQFGIVRIDFDCVESNVRKMIESEQVPLGRVLIEHNVLREVHLTALWKVTPGPDLCKMFGIAPGEVIYGRTAMIDLDMRQAVELLEIVAPTGQTT